MIQPNVDFSERSFIEHISLAAREPVYSASISWLVGRNSPLPLDRRAAFLRRVVGMDMSDARSIECVTEWHDIDLLITADCGPNSKRFVAVENKIKSAESRTQLAANDIHLRRLDGPVTKVFLTLTGERASNPDWHAITYDAIVQALDEAIEGQSNVILAELRSSLARLVAAVAEAKQNPRVAAFAFADEDAPDDLAIGSYIDEMRLQKVLQRAWMLEVGRRVLALSNVAAPWAVSTNETHGQALLNIEASCRTEKGPFRVGIQVQWRTLKAFCCPDPYPPKASSQQHDGVSAMLETIRQRLQIPRAVKPSRKLARGFRSYRADAMPEARSVEAWAEKVASAFGRLREAFPEVQSIADDSERVTEDE